MKQAVLLMMGALFLAGCSRQEREPAARAASATPVPIAAAQTPASTNRVPTALAIFLRTPPPGILKPESEAGRIVVKAQELFQQGQTNAAVDLLDKAVSNPACAADRPVLSRKLITLLLYCGRLADAQAAYVESLTDEKAAAMNISMVHGYLLEKGDAAAVVEWAARLEALSLPGPAAEGNLANHLVALTKCDRMDEATTLLQQILSRTNEVKNTRLVGNAAYGLIRRSEFDQTERLLDAIEVAAGGRNAYTGIVTNLRKELKSARAKPATPTPGK